MTLLISFKIQEKTSMIILVQEDPTEEPPGEEDDMFLFLMKVLPFFMNFDKLCVGDSIVYIFVEVLYWLSV